MLAIVGAGHRGLPIVRHVLANPERAQLVALVDPNESNMAIFEESLELPNQPKRFADYKAFLDADIPLDGVIVATPPNTHAEITCAFLTAGVRVYLEKPMAHSLTDAVKIIKTAEKVDMKVQIGFNMRHAPFFAKAKEVVASGTLGRLVLVEWKEMISPAHWATYCRHSSYSKREVIGAWLTEKSCHDIDMINWIVDDRCKRVASFAKRSHFLPREDLPKCCPDKCPLAKSCLFVPPKYNKEETPYFHMLFNESPVECVYNADSDLFDHQSSILEYESGLTVGFSLIPLHPHDRREFTIIGTEATLKGDEHKSQLRLIRHTGQEELVAVPPGELDDHGGGDIKIMSSFLNYLDSPSYIPEPSMEVCWDDMVVVRGIDMAAKEHRVVELDYAFDFVGHEGLACP